MISSAVSRLTGSNAAPLSSFGARHANSAERAADGDHQIMTRINAAAFGIVGEGMHRRQHARAHQEGADQAQRKRGDREQQCPGAERAGAFSRERGMQQRRRDQPRHQRRVLHRIPEPETAPAQIVIGPPATKRDAERERDPGGKHEGPRRARPRRVGLAA